MSFTCSECGEPKVCPVCDIGVPAHQDTAYATVYYSEEGQELAATFFCLGTSWKDTEAFAVSRHRIITGVIIGYNRAADSCDEYRMTDLYIPLFEGDRLTFSHNPDEGLGLPRLNVARTYHYDIPTA